MKHKTESFKFSNGLTVTVCWYIDLKLVMVEDDTDIAPLVVFKSTEKDSSFGNYETFKAMIGFDLNDYFEMYDLYKKIMNK